MNKKLQKKNNLTVKDTIEKKSGVKNGVGEGRRKQETDTEDKTGKKVMICVIAKKMQ